MYLNSDDSGSYDSSSQTASSTDQTVSTDTQPASSTDQTVPTDAQPASSSDQQDSTDPQPTDANSDPPNVVSEQRRELARLLARDIARGRKSHGSSKKRRELVEMLTRAAATTDQSGALLGGVILDPSKWHYTGLTDIYDGQ